jgi:hypothetical protein
MSVSSSTSTPVTSPNNIATQDILNQISGIASQLSNQLLTWGSNVFQNVNSVTNANIGQFLQGAAQAGNLATNTINDYENSYAPLGKQLIQDANSYASDNRIQSEMGSAEANTTQAMDQGRINAEKNLEGYGIDVSGGRYAELEQAQRAGAAAAAVGAGQQSRLATEATGRNLRSQAIAVGQQLPGQAVNALNAEVQNLTGATNTVLGAANTGVNLTTPGLAALKTAAEAPKFTPSGQNSKSASSSGGGGGGKGSSDPSGIGNFGHGSANQGQNNENNPTSPIGQNIMQDKNGPPPVPVTKSAPGKEPTDGTQQYDANGNPITPAMGPIDPNLTSPQGYDGQINGGTDLVNNFGIDQSLMQPSADLSGTNPQGSASNPFAGTPNNIQQMDPNATPAPNNLDPNAFTNPSQNSAIMMPPQDSSVPSGTQPVGFTAPDTTGYTPPPDMSAFSGNQNFGQGNYTGQAGGYGQNPTGGNYTGQSGGYTGQSGGYTGQAGGYGQNPTGGNYTGQSGGYGGGYAAGAGGSGGYGGGYAASAGGSGGYASGGGGYASGGGYAATSGGYGGGYGGGGGGGYARGGAIPDPRARNNRPMRRGAFGATTGGHVPAAASPSRGQRTDDVKANLNAGEFVIPKDVAAWKGQEFFQKLIMQSRKSRVTAPAHGTPAKQQAGPARFQSQSMGMG